MAQTLSTLPPKERVYDTMPYTQRFYRKTPLCPGKNIARGNLHNDYLSIRVPHDTVYRPKKVSSILDNFLRGLSVY